VPVMSSGLNGGRRRRPRRLAPPRKPRSKVDPREAKAQVRARILACRRAKLESVYIAQARHVSQTHFLTKLVALVTNPKGHLLWTCCFHRSRQIPTAACWFHRSRQIQMCTGVVQVHRCTGIVQVCNGCRRSTGIQDY
jgi:hypothetical protein